MYCKKIVIIGPSQLNLFHAWQVQLLMGTGVTFIGCYADPGLCPQLPADVSVLFLTDRKPAAEQLARFTGQIFHAPTTPALNPTLQLSRLKPDGRWQKVYETCLPSKKQTETAEKQRARPARPHTTTKVHAVAA